jgi:hypothetical protein
VVAKARGCTCESLEYLDLHGGVGDVVLATNDVGHAEIDVVDHRGQRVEITFILTAQDGVGERRAIDMAFAAHQVVPAHGRGVKAKTPMRLAARAFERGPLVRRQTQGGAVIDRRKTARLLALAAPVKLVRRLIGRIEPAQILKLRGGRVVGRHPLRLAAHQVRPNSEPFQIRLDRIGVFRLRTLEIGIVEAEDERAAAAAREEPVEKRGAGVADMDAAGRRWREPDHRRRGHSPS